MTQLTRNALILLILILVIPTWISAAEVPESMLGNSGEVFSAEAGSYGDLFPQGDFFEAEQPVLALEIVRPGIETQRLLVPTTGGSEVESAPRLFYSKAGAALNVLWTSRLDDEVSLYLARFQENEWPSVEEIYFSQDGLSPTVAVTRDAFRLERDDEPPIHLEREVLHLAWTAEGDGVPAVKYAPIVLLNGSFIGWRETFSLHHLNANANEQVSTLLPEILHVRPDDDADTIIMTFGSAESGRLTSSRIAVVPMELTHLGSLIREFVLDSDFDPQDVAHFADLLGTHIIGVGTRGRGPSRLNSTAMGYVAEQVSARARETGAGYTATEVEAFAEDLRDYTVELARSLFPTTAVALPKGSNAPDSIVEIDVGDLFEEPEPAAIHVLEIDYAIERPVPDTAGAALTVLTSDDGTSFLAAWIDAEEEGTLWYVESDLDGWSEPRALHLGDALTLEQAHRLLQERIR